MEVKPAESHTITPHSFITEENVKQVLLADKGNGAYLKSWEIVDFTKRGDNYACVVTSIEVKYSKNNQDFDVSYVVKLNACRNLQGFPDVSWLMFTKEGKFYQEIVPDLNAQLISAGQDPLRFPKCFLLCLEEGKEQIYFEDLRPRGFKMTDKKQGVDKDHATLVMAELARLHAASYLLKCNFPMESWGVKYDFLLKSYLSYEDDNAKDMMMSVFESHINKAKAMLDKIGGYEKATVWLEGLKPEVETLFTTSMKSERFKSICHGDCWNNNILFRYDDEGLPVEVMLVDLQVCREASLASDLNYFLLTSVPGEMRTSNTGHYMATYYSSYKTVVEGGNQAMYFNEEELTNEYRHKNKFGLFCAMGIIPTLLMEPDETPDMSGNVDIQEMMKQMQAKSLEKLDTNPMCKPRFLSLFDECIETGLIS